MINRRSMLRGGSAAALGMLAITAVESRVNPASAATAEPGPASSYKPRFLGNPAVTGESLPWPKHLDHEELEHLKTFEVADFVVFDHQEWNRLGESHAPWVRVHWPDGHYTDGLDQHIKDMKALFVWGPDIQVTDHPVRVAKGNLTAVMGVFQGTFSHQMPDGKGGFIKPTHKKFAVTMITVGIWNPFGTMDEEFLLYDNLTLYQQLGLA